MNISYITPLLSIFFSPFLDLEAPRALLGSKNWFDAVAVMPDLGHR